MQYKSGAEDISTMRVSDQQRLAASTSHDVGPSLVHHVKVSSLQLSDYPTYGLQRPAMQRTDNLGAPFTRYLSNVFSNPGSHVTASQHTFITNSLTFFPSKTSWTLFRAQSICESCCKISFPSSTSWQVENTKKHRSATTWAIIASASTSDQAKVLPG